jgi:hypothetical protein
MATMGVASGSADQVHSEFFEVHTVQTGRWPSHCTTRSVCGFWTEGSSLGRPREHDGSHSQHVPWSFFGDKHCRQQLSVVAWLYPWSGTLLWPSPNSLSCSRPCPESDRPCLELTRKRAGDRLRSETRRMTQGSVGACKGTVEPSD